MKKAGISSFLFAPLLLLIVSPAFAETTIKTGNSTAEVHVNTNVGGSSTNESTSNIHTHIEVETNGDKKVLDEDGPGNYTVTSNSENGGESSVNVTTNSNSENDASTKSADSKMKEQKEDVEVAPKTPAALIVNFFKGIGGFFLRVIRNL